MMMMMIVIRAERVLLGSAIFMLSAASAAIPLSNTILQSLSNRSVNKPLILQELPHHRSVSRVELHNLEYESFILIDDLSFAEILEWFQLLGRHCRHDPNDYFLGVLVGDLLIGDRERPRSLVLIHNDFRIVHLMAFWLFRLKNMGN